MATEEASKKIWDNYSDEYEKQIFYSAIPVYRTMIPLLKLESSTTIVEAACGTGHGLPILREIVPPSIKILANDFSEVMVSKSISRNCENVDIAVASNSALPYPDGCCDRYIANFSLHLVSDPKGMLAEAYRVLQPGGIAAFSVWGKQTDTNLFVITAKAQEKAGIEIKGLSFFHLGDLSNARNILIEAGFVDVKGFYTTTAVDAQNGNEAIEHIKTSPQISFLSRTNPEKYQEVIDCIRLEAERVLESGNLLTFDALVIIGRKN